jgi:hypothetical protein
MCRVMIARAMPLDSRIPSKQIHAKRIRMNIVNNEVGKGNETSPTRYSLALAAETTAYCQIAENRDYCSDCIEGCSRSCHNSKAFRAEVDQITVVSAVVWHGGRILAQDRPENIEQQSGNKKRYYRIDSRYT